MNNSVKQEKNYWPHAIVTVLIFMVFACAMVVKIAMDNPVQMDSFYLEKYQKVNEDINEIKEKQKIFEENFVIKYQTEKFTIGKPNTFKMSIENIKNQSIVKNAEIKLVLSRPDTNEFNQEFNLKNAVNGVFIIDNIKVNKPGRWQILTKIKIGDKSSYNQYEVYASK
jgi:hypothetical protein